jgi:hypothetical protein
MIEVVSEPPPALGGRGQSPSLAIASSGPVVLYRREWWVAADGSSLDEDLLYASRTPMGWVREVVYDGQFLLNGPGDPADDVWDFAQFPTMVLDRCGNPHAAFYLNHRIGAVSDSGVYYSTKGEPCGGAFSSSLRVEPRTLNLRSRGRWVTGEVAFDEEVAAEVDLDSLSLAGVPADRVHVVNGTAVIAKFPRDALAATIERLGSVEVCVEGALRDGRTFRTCDTIRVIQPGR